MSKLATSIAFLGDSITNAQATVISTSTSVYTLGWSFGHWLQVFLRQRFHVVGVYGYSGNTMSQIAGHVADALANNPRYLFLLGGINSLEGGVSASSIIADMQVVYAACAAKGVVVIHGTILPSSALTSAITSIAAKHVELDKVNAWIQSEGARTPGVIVIPWHVGMADLTTNGPITNTTQDGTHPRIVGAQRIAKIAADILAPLVPDSAAALPATNADATNAITNAMMLGTGGQLNFAGNAGVATSWFVNTTGTQTVVPAKVARADGYGEWQQMQITAGTPSAADGTNEAHLSQVLAAFPASGGTINQGDLIYAQVEFETDADWANASLLQLQLRDSSTANKTRALAGTDATDKFQNGSVKGVIRTAPILAPSTALTLFVFISGLNSGSTATIRIGRVSVAKVQNSDGLL